MSDFELRKILRDVIDDVDRGRLRLRRPLRLARGALLPAALAAGLGLGLAACDTNGVGSPQDAGPDIVDAAYMAPDVADIVDAAYAAPDVAIDAIAPAYMGPIIDAGTDAEVVDDAEVDSGMNTLYMGPPPIEPD